MVFLGNVHSVLIGEGHLQSEIFWSGSRHRTCFLERSHDLGLSPDCAISEAFRSVVVHHANRLHKRVTDSWANEPEASFA